MPPRDPTGDDFPESEREYRSYPSDPSADPTEEFSAATESLSEEELTKLRYDSSGVPLGPRKATVVADTASPFVMRYLFPTEKFRGEWRKHWSYLADQFLYGALATFFFGWLWGFLMAHHQRTLSTVVVILWLLVMLWVASRVADWYFNRFILTNKRIMQVSGIVARTVAMMPLLRVTDMRYEQTTFGRLLGYGDFLIESAGQDQALREVRHLPHPNELYLRIVEEMYEPEAVEAKLAVQNATDDGS
jgi:membrane protein YdbS with pleckstrin-like domain